MHSSLKLTSILLTGALFCGCAPGIKDLGAISKSGFYHETYSYQLPFESGEQASFLSEDWRLANWVPLDSTSVGNQKRGNQPRRIAGAEWTRTFEIDDDLNGTVDKTVTLPAYDLYFENREHDSVVWLKSLPLSSTETEKDLEVFAERYLNALSGNIGHQAASLKQSSGSTRVSSVSFEERYGAKLVESERTKVSGHPALRAVFERYNLDQHAIDQAHIESKTVIYFVQSDRTWELKRSVRKTVQFPILFVVGGASEKEDFQATEAAVISLTSRLQTYTE